MDHSEVKHFPKVDHTPAVMDEKCRVILDAAALIESKGWIQGGWISPRGYCMRGAVYGVIGEVKRADAWPVLDYMESRMPPGESCMYFNDTAGRTKDEVISKMRAIALGL